jgi:hypothetical protein
LPALLSVSIHRFNCPVARPACFAPGQSVTVEVDAWPNTPPPKPARQGVIEIGREAVGTVERGARPVQIQIGGIVEHGLALQATYTYSRAANNANVGEAWSAGCGGPRSW